MIKILKYKNIFFILFIFIFITPLWSNTLSTEEKIALQKRENFIDAAMAYKGVPYKYGGTTRAGLDCSGLIYMAAKDSGTVILPRTSAQMYNYSTKINKSQLQKGDLVFFSASGSTVSHVGIYIGNNEMLHCASSGSKTGVIITKLSENYWAKTYYGCGRIFDSTSAIASDKKTSTSKNNSSSYNLDYMFLPFFNMDVTSFINWNFFTEKNFQFYIQSFSLEFEIMTNFLKYNFGIMTRPSFDLLLNDSIVMPVCLTFHLNKYIKFYTGPVFTFQKPILIESKKEILPNIYPGIFGVAFKTPKIQFLNTNISLVQDISFTFCKDSNGNNLSFMEALAGGTSFSTGISVTLPH